jgi:hypothetical protein
MQTRETITKPQNEVEYQNDFTSEGGTLHGAVKTVMDKTNMLANTVETVKKARELGATIVYAPITFTEDYHELSPTPYGILKGVVDSKSFRQGTWGAAIVDVLKPEPGDIVIEGKRGLDGFATTNLDFILRGRAYRPSRSADSSPIAASNRRCGPDTRRATTSSRSRTAPRPSARKCRRPRSRRTIRCSRSR